MNTLLIVASLSLTIGVYSLSRFTALPWKTLIKDT